MQILYIIFSPQPRCSFTVECFSRSWFSTGAAPIGVVEAGGSQQPTAVPADLSIDKNRRKAEVVGGKSQDVFLEEWWPPRETKQTNQPVKCFFEKKGKVRLDFVTWRWWTKRKAKKKENWFKLITEFILMFYGPFFWGLSLKCKWWFPVIFFMMLVPSRRPTAQRLKHLLQQQAVPGWRCWEEAGSKVSK